MLLQLRRPRTLYLAGDVQDFHRRRYRYGLFGGDTDRRRRPQHDYRVLNFPLKKDWNVAGLGNYFPFGGVTRRKAGMWLPSPLTGPPPSCWRAASAWFCAGFGFLWWLFWAALAGAWAGAGAGAGSGAAGFPVAAAEDVKPKFQGCLLGVHLFDFSGYIFRRHQTHTRQHPATPPSQHEPPPRTLPRPDDNILSSYHNFLISFL